MDQAELLRSLTALLDAGRWEDAYIWFREHQNAFTRREQRLLRALLLRRLWHSPVLLALTTMAIQILFGGIFTNQLQDFFSFLGRSFRPYMYVARVVPLVVNVVLAAILAVQCYERLVFTSRMLGRRPPWSKVAGAWLLAAVLAGWSMQSLVPYAKDLPLVLDRAWYTASISREQEEATAKNNVLVQMDREPEGSYDPIPWCSNPPWPQFLLPVLSDPYNRWVVDIHVDDVTCRIGQLQFRMTDYKMNAYPVWVDYLPNSKLVLWISCGEEGAW